MEIEMNYIEVKKEIKNVIDKFVSEWSYGNSFYGDSWEAQKLVANNLEKFGFENILKSSINLYSKYFNELSERLNIKPEKTYTSMDKLAQEFRQIEENKKINNPLRMKINYCRKIYDWLTDYAKDKCIETSLFSDIFDESLDRWDISNPSRRNFQSDWSERKMIKNFPFKLEETLN